MELYSHRRFSWGAAFWGFVAGVLVVVGLVVDNPHFLVAALAPGTLALGLWFVHPREFHAFVNEDGLKVERPAAKIPFSDLEGLTVNGMDQDPADPRFRPGPMVIMHRRGVLHVPAALNLPMQDVYRAILAMLPPHGSHAVSAEFTEHFRKEEAVFGPERVHAFGRRHFAGYRPSTRRGQICAILLVLCGIAWCVVGAMAVRGGKRSAYEPWLGVGIGLIAVGAMSGLALYSWQRPSERRLRAFLNAELIISPTGIALWQGDLKGQLGWEELQDVVWKRRRAFDLTHFTVGADGVLGGGVCLLFAGARVCIPDIYDRPLPIIHKLIRHYWKGE